VPASQIAQFTDIAQWIMEDRKAEDKVIVISEKEARQNDAGRALRTIIERSGITYTPFSYSILEGRDIQGRLEAAMTSSGTNRVVIASESEAFVNDAVRNLNLIVHNKFQVILYAPAKIRSFETIEVENFHNTSLHASLTYNIDYEDRKVQDFIRRYRAMFGTEPTQFAFQGYDIARYFVDLASRYGKGWTSHLKGEKAEMLQNSFMFRTNGDGGYVNSGIRRIIYGKDYQIQEVL
jgi:ABC-type branched-subunit amino acid transport system substrate-binding protein